MIPTELLPIISEHLNLTNPPSPIIFDIPVTYQLHRLITVPLCRLLPLPMPPVIQPQQVLTQPQKAPKPNTSFVNLLWNPKFVRKAFVASSSVKASSSGTGQATSYSFSLSTPSYGNGMIAGRRRTLRPMSVSLLPSLTQRHPVSSPAPPGILDGNEKASHE